jgi:hypothetical protein
MLQRSQSLTRLALAALPLTASGLIVVPISPAGAEPKPVEPDVETVALEVAGQSSARAGGALRLTRVAGRLESEQIDTAPFELAALTWDGVEHVDATMSVRTRTAGIGRRGQNSRSTMPITRRTPTPPSPTELVVELSR